MRQLVITLLFFAAPFAAYALYRIADQRRRGEFERVWEAAPVFWLAVTGLAFVVIGLILISVFGQTMEPYVVPIYPKD